MIKNDCKLFYSQICTQKCIYHIFEMRNKKVAKLNNLKLLNSSTSARRPRVSQKILNVGNVELRDTHFPLEYLQQLPRSRCRSFYDF